jgi:hypothetical protein
VVEWLLLYLCVGVTVLVIRVDQLERRYFGGRGREW